MLMTKTKSEKIFTHLLIETIVWKKKKKKLSLSLIPDGFPRFRKLKIKLFLLLLLLLFTPVFLIWGKTKNQKLE